MSFIGSGTSYPVVAPASSDTVPIIQGGVVKQALIASLGAVSGGNDVTTLTSAAGVVDIDCSLGDYFQLTLTENITSLTFSNPPGAGKGASKLLWITQGAGPYTFAYPASFKWRGGLPVAVSTVNGAVDLMGLATRNNATAWDVTLSKARA